VGQGLDVDAFREVNIGLGVGRRLMWGDTAFDLVLEPAVTAMQLEWDFTSTQDIQGEDVELSVNALARVALPITKRWALTITLEGDLIPGNLSSSPAHLDVPSGASQGASAPPTFPAWTGGVRFGAMGAVL
jgi:hypothetical protein